MDVIKFKGQLLHYNVFYFDENTFCVDIGDGELNDKDGENYFWHIEYHLDIEEYVFEMWYDDYFTTVILSPEEREYLIMFVQQLMKNGE